MTKGNIKCGICGFNIQVEADCSDGQHVNIKLESTCPSYKKIAEELTEVDAYRDVFQKLHESKVYEVVSKYSKHPSCPGISGILKTVEVAAGMALPQEASMKIER